MQEFFMSHGNTLSWAVVSIVLFFIPNDKLYDWGLLVRKKLPKDVATKFGNKFAYFINGLKGVDVDGDCNLIKNSQLEEAADKYKIDLGLGDKD